MLVARCAAVLGLLVVLGGGAVAACGQTSGNGPGTSDAGSGVDADDGVSFDACFGMCISLCAPTGPATLNLSCPSVVTSVLSTGSCTARGCPKGGVSCAQEQVSIEPTQAGVCHVDLTLAGGFQYSTDVTFTQTTTEGCCPCTSIGPTQTMFMVNNPSTTCVDAGASDAGTDASTDAQADDGGGCGSTDAECGSSGGAGNRRVSRAVPDSGP